MKYDNYFEHVDWKTFSNNYWESGDYDECMGLIKLFHECINEDSTKRPSLCDLEKYFYKLI